MVQQIEATLSSTGGDVWDVILNATVVRHPGNESLEEIGELRSGPLNAPDGDYVIEYSWNFKAFRQRVRVKNGTIINTV